LLSRRRHQVEVDGAIAYKLIDDDHDFLHLRTKEEIEWEKQQRRDNNNPAITIPVRLRDGDACRWCGKVVDWGTKNGARSGTYDHLIPGRAATVETSVVACRGCNSSRGKAESLEWQDREPLPVPAEPYFSAATIDRLKKNRWAKEHGYEVPARSRKTVSPGNPAPHMAAESTSQSPAPAASTAPAGERPDNQSATAGTPDLNDAPAQRTDTTSANAPSNTRPDTTSANATKPVSTSGNERLARNVQESASTEGMTLVVPGRDGTGLGGSGRVGSGAPLLQNPPSESPSARNSSRGRRRRKRGRGTQSQNRSSGDPRG
ncbi:HNH endonuclease, partial [Rhodococcus qingshengii]|uniref:HNH endonuclease n=1 Tax=Rhodococcus qingshengii TaxID=334542 RepID=UPI001BE51397